jgi:hypothetical protein
VKSNNVFRKSQNGVVSIDPLWQVHSHLNRERLEDLPRLHALRYMPYGEASFPGRLWPSYLPQGYRGTLQFLAFEQDGMVCASAGP